MRQTNIFGRIAVSFMGILLLAMLEGLLTLGHALDFETYSTLGWILQCMAVYVTAWVANRMYEES